jgi:hypothetical protein
MKILFIKDRYLLVLIHIHTNTDSILDQVFTILPKPLIKSIASIKNNN